MIHQAFGNHSLSSDFFLGGKFSWWHHVQDVPVQRKVEAPFKVLGFTT